MADNEPSHQNVHCLPLCFEFWLRFCVEQCFWPDSKMEEATSETQGWKGLLAFSRSTGFILEGFPRTPEETRFLADAGLFPDSAIVLTVDDSDVTGRLLPPKLEKWRVKRDKRLAKRQKKKEKAQKKRVCRYTLADTLVIQLDQNQFGTFCPNRSWFFWIFWNFIGQIIKARKSLFYSGFSGRCGAGVIIAISLQGLRLVTVRFWHEKGQLVLLFRGHFLCHVISIPLQNHECNILPGMVSYVNKFDEIKGSHLNRIRSYLHFSQTN